MTAVLEVESLEKELTALDRCDRCGAQAYMQMIKDDIDLLFCGHHGKKFAPTLVDRHWKVLDSTHKINESPSPSNADI